LSALDNTRSGKRFHGFYRVAKLLYYSSLHFYIQKKICNIVFKKTSFEKDGLMLICQKVDARNRLSNLDGIEVFSVVIRRVVNVMSTVLSNSTRATHSSNSYPSAVDIRNTTTKIICITLITSRIWRII
jgi:hypothetical protein